MKARRTVSFSALLVALLGLGTAAAQGLRVVAKADIPFKYYVGDKVLPSGAYTFGRSARQSSPVMEIRGEKASMYRLFTPGRTVSADQQCEAVFRKYKDGTYFLAEIRLPGLPVQRVVKSRIEEGYITTDWSVQEIAILLQPEGSRTRH